MARRFTQRTLTAVLASLAVAGSAGAATASAAHISSNSGGANVRANSNAGSASLAYLRNGTPVAMFCWRDDAWALGNYWTNRWFYITSPRTGWVHASLVANQSAVRWCG